MPRAIPTMISFDRRARKAATRINGVTRELSASVQKLDDGRREYRVSGFAALFESGEWTWEGTAIY